MRHRSSVLRGGFSLGHVAVLPLLLSLSYVKCTSLFRHLADTQRSGDADHWTGRCAVAFRVDTGLSLIVRRLGEQAMETARQVALEASQRALARLALGFLAREVLLGGGIALGTGDRDHVERVVELAIPAAVEAVLRPLPR